MANRESTRRDAEFNRADRADRADADRADRAGFSRRDFLKGAAALQLGLFVTKLGGDVVLARVSETGDPLPASGASPDEIAALAEATPLNIYVSIDTDDTVTIVVPRPDMGQGSRTSLAMHVAEELEAHWDKVVILQGDASSEYGISQTSGGSTSTRNFWAQTRQAGAAARMMLTQAAAEHWGVHPDTTRCTLGAVHHDETGRRVTYGELAEAAAAQTVPSNPPLKSPDDYTIIGQATLRKDGPELVDGSGVFGGDVRVPGLLHAAVARPHAFGSSMSDHDDTDALAAPGVRSVVRASGGLAVVADSTWAALKGRDRLQITWNPGPNVGVGDAEIRSRLVQGVGSLPSMPDGTDNVIEATYDLPYLAHAPMEPMNCVADVRDGRCEVWTPTQAPGSARSGVARALGFSESNVTVHVTYTGGGFGRRLSTDYATEAARISRDVGAPVHVLWTRDDDMRHDYYRPASHHAMRGGLNGDGRITGWAHRMAIASRGGDEDAADAEWIDPGEMPDEIIPGIDQDRPPYDFLSRASFDSRRIGLPLPTGAWRSVNNTQVSFANESFFDEMAHGAGRDPYELRLELLNNSRLRGTLELAGQQAGWGGSLPHGRGRGVACFSGYGSYCVHVVEVEVTHDGIVRVHRVVTGVDCGIAVNPLGIRAQMEGGVSDGLSTALKAEITVTDGAVNETSYMDYEWLRIDEMPEVEVHIVPSRASVGGIGEVGFPAVSPALANAIFDATGRRLRRLPIRQEDLAGWTEPPAVGTPTEAPTEPATDTPTPEPATVTPTPGTPTATSTPHEVADEVYLPRSEK